MAKVHDEQRKCLGAGQPLGELLVQGAVGRRQAQLGEVAWRGPEGVDEEDVGVLEDSVDEVDGHLFGFDQWTGAAERMWPSVEAKWSVSARYPRALMISTAPRPGCS